MRLEPVRAQLIMNIKNGIDEDCSADITHSINLAARVAAEKIIEAPGGTRKGEAPIQTGRIYESTEEYDS